MFTSRFWSARYWASRVWSAPGGGDGLSPETAIPITSLPYSDCADPGIDFATRWYKYTPTADNVLSGYPCPTDPATGANVNIWTGTDPGSLTYQGYNAMGPYVWPVKLGGDDIYFEVYVDDPAGGEICFSVITPTNTPIQRGDLVISEDEGHPQLNLYDPSFKGFWPYIWYGPDGTLRSVNATLPATELGACLNNGIWAIISRDTNQVFIYDVVPGVTEIGRFPLPGVPGPDNYNWTRFGTDFVDFYALYSANSTDPIQIYKITAAGVITGPIATGAFPGSFTPRTVGISRDGGILYYAAAGAGTGIHRHNLLTNTPLSDIPAANALDYTGDVIVLTDGTIVAQVQNNFGFVSSTNLLVHWAADGTLLHRWTIDAYPYQPHAICHVGDNNSDTVWFWTQWITAPGAPNVSGYNRFRRVHVATGSTEQEFTKGNFSEGIGPYDDTDACGSPYFGAPDSCPLFVMMDADTPVPPLPPIEEICPGGGLPLAPGSPNGYGCVSC